MKRLNSSKIADELNDSNATRKKKSKLEKTKVGGMSKSIPKRIQDMQTEGAVSKNRKKKKKKKKGSKDDKIVNLTGGQQTDTRNRSDILDAGDQLIERVRRIVVKLALPLDTQHYVRALQLKKLKDISIWTSHYPSMSAEVRRCMVKQRIACFMGNRPFDGERFLRVKDGSPAKPGKTKQTRVLKHNPSVFKKIQKKLNCSRKGVGKAKAMFLDCVTIAVKVLADLKNGDDMTELQKTLVEDGLTEMDIVTDLLLLAPGEMRYCLYVSNLPKFTRRGKLMLALSGEGHQPTYIWLQGSHRACVEYDTPGGFQFGLKMNGKLFGERVIAVTHQPDNAVPL